MPAGQRSRCTATHRTQDFVIVSWNRPAWPCAAATWRIGAPGSLPDDAERADYDWRRGPHASTVVLAGTAVEAVAEVASDVISNL